MLFSRKEKEGYISESQGLTKGSLYLYNFTTSLASEMIWVMLQDGGMKKVTGVTLGFMPSHRCQSVKSKSETSHSTSFSQTRIFKRITLISRCPRTAACSERLGVWNHKTEEDLTPFGGSSHHVSG